MEEVHTRKGETARIEHGLFATVWDGFGNVIGERVIVIGYEHKNILRRNDVSRKFNVEFIPGKALVVGDYGLKGGGKCFSKCGTATNSPDALAKIKEGISNDRRINRGKEQHNQFEISENIDLLLTACKNSVIENIVISLKYLSGLKVYEFTSPIQTAISLLKCLENEGIWEQVTWTEVRKKIANLSRKLLLYSFHKEKNKVQMFSSTKDALLPVSNGIIDRIIEEERNFPENGLLCEMKAILAIMKSMKDSERWYKSFIRRGKDLFEIIYNQDVQALTELLTDIRELVSEKVNHRMSVHLFYLDFISIQEIETRVDFLSTFLQRYQSAKWQILYPIIEEIEPILFSTSELSHKTLLFLGDSKKVGLKALAGFNTYLLADNWRIRERIAVILMKIVNSSSELKGEAEDVIADRIVFETDIRVKDILSDPAIVEASHALIEASWERKKERFERLLDEEKAILMRLETKFHQCKVEEQAGMLEVLKNQRTNFEKQLDGINQLAGRLGKAIDFLDSYEAFTSDFKNTILSAIQESHLNLERNIDRKFSDVMHKLASHSPRSSLTSLYYMPNSSNYFLGRESELSQMQHYLEKFKKKTFILAVVGIGGVGKTQLILEFANQNREYFGATWYINAESRSKIEASFMEMADILQIDMTLKISDLTRKVLIHLGRQIIPWLLVYDGVVNPKDIDSFVPHGKGMVLITSRNSCWDLCIPLQGLDRESSLVLLENMTRIERSTCAERIAEELGDLPLALCQAAAFIKQTNADYEEYYNIIVSRASSILDLNENTESLAFSWNINLLQIAEENKTCRHWLECLAYLSPNSIPDKLSRSIFEQIESKDNLFNYKRIIKLALGYSLIEVNEKKCINMHKLVQSFIRKAVVKDTDVPLVLETVFLSLFTIEQELELNKSLVDHLQFFLSIYKANSAESGELYSRLGVYFLEIMRNIPLASSCMHSAIKIKVEKYGKTSPEAASSYNNLGNVFFEQLDLKQAIYYYRKALSIKQRHLEPNALELAYSYNNLGICHFQESNMPEAVTYILKAMKIMKMHLGEDDISITTTYMNLGMAYDEMGDYDDAERYLKLAMDVRAAQLPAKHQDIADCLLNLGILHSKTNDNAKGVKEIRQAYDMLVECLGVDNPASKNAKDVLQNLENKIRVSIT